MKDLTYPISETMLLYPGIPQPRLHDLARPEIDGYGMSEFTFWNHLGTHIDAPTHFYADGCSLDQFPVDRFVTMVHTIDCRGLTVIQPQHLSPILTTVPRGEAVLLLTGQYRYWGTPQYFEPFPVLNDAAADLLVDHEVGMILVDAPSVDRVDTTDFPNHHRLLHAPRLIVENLAYHDDLPQRFKMAALPLKIQSSNGSPARVIAWD